MNKIIILVMFLLLLGTIVTAQSYDDLKVNFGDYLKLEQEKKVLEQENLLLKEQIKQINSENNKELVNLMNRCIFIEPNKNYLVYDNNISIKQIITW